jgi:hypothetical protein
LAVTVDVNGQAVAAKVLAISAADKWVVRFEKYGPEYDQEVGVDRIKAAAPPKGEKAAEAKAEKAAPPKGEKATEAKAEKAAEAKAEKAAEAKAEKAAPPKPKVEGGPAPAAGPPAVGENVLVGVRGAWFAASVVALGTGTVKVKFAAGGEEEVAADRVLRAPEGKGQPYQPGQLVLVDYKGVFVPAKVLKQEAKGEYKVRFDGQGPEGDEVIPVRRLRPR